MLLLGGLLAALLLVGCWLLPVLLLLLPVWLMLLRMVRLPVVLLRVAVAVPVAVPVAVLLLVSLLLLGCRSLQQQNRRHANRLSNCEHSDKRISE